MRLRYTGLTKNSNAAGLTGGAAWILATALRIEVRGYEVRPFALVAAFTAPSAAVLALPFSTSRRCVAAASGGTGLM